MNNLLKKQLALTLILAAPISIHAQTVLTVKPKKCVSLHKGQTCYQTLKFRWHGQGKKMCLYLQSQKAPMHCSQNKGATTFRYEFESAEGQTFILRNTENNEEGRISVEVASVYKGKRSATTGWRIF